MPPDKFAAVWLSHSSIRDFLNCPRAYYLNNVYKNPKTRRKISLITPPLALGHIVHLVLDEISALSLDERLTTPLLERFEKAWPAITGKKGGFRDIKEEKVFKQRGVAMLENIEKNPGPLVKKAIKLKENLPYFWLSEEENLILCGKIDWLEYIEKDDSIGIIDFKTGKREEREDSLQLPIYYLLAAHAQARPVTKVSWWYIERDSKPTSVPLPNETDSKDKIMEVARRIKLARQLDHFKCSRDEENGCIHCAPLEAIVAGLGEFVGLGDYKEELYILPDKAVSL